MGWTIEEIATVVIPNSKIKSTPNSTKKGIITANGAPLDVYNEKEEAERIAMEVIEETTILNKNIKKSLRPAGRLRVEAKYDKRPGRVQYPDIKEIDKMNVESMLAKLKKGIVKYDLKRQQVIYVLLHIDLMYKIKSISSFSITELWEFMSKDLEIPLTRGHMSEIMVYVVRDLIALKLMVKERRQLRIIDSKFFSYDVEHWSKYLNEKKQLYKKAPEKSSVKTKPIQLSEKTEVKTKPIQLTGKAEVKTSVMKIEITIDETLKDAIIKLANFINIKVA